MSKSIAVQEMRENGGLLSKYDSGPKSLPMSQSIAVQEMTYSDPKKKATLEYKNF